MSGPPTGFLTGSILVGDPEAWRGCGVAPLDDFFRRYALPNDQRGLGKTFVLRRSEGDPLLPALLGFYTLSMATIEATRLSPSLQKALPRYPLPVALIGRLAVSTEARGRGYGEALIGDALNRVLAASQLVGCFGIVVDAKDEGAVSFYSKYGFARFDESARYPSRMFLPLATVAAVHAG